MPKTGEFEIIRKAGRMRRRAEVFCLARLETATCGGEVIQSLVPRHVIAYQRYGSTLRSVFHPWTWTTTTTTPTSAFSIPPHWWRLSPHSLSSYISGQTRHSFDFTFRVRPAPHILFLTFNNSQINHGSPSHCRPAHSCLLLRLVRHRIAAT